MSESAASTLRPEPPHSPQHQLKLSAPSASPFSPSGLTLSSPAQHRHAQSHSHLTLRELSSSHSASIPAPVSHCGFSSSETLPAPPVRHHHDGVKSLSADFHSECGALRTPWQRQRAALQLNATAVDLCPATAGSTSSSLSSSHSSARVACCAQSQAGCSLLMPSSPQSARSASSTSSFSAGPREGRTAAAAAAEPWGGDRQSPLHAPLALRSCSALLFLFL